MSSKLSAMNGMKIREMRIQRDFFPKHLKNILKFHIDCCIESKSRLNTMRIKTFLIRNLERNCSGE